MNRDEALFFVGIGGMGMAPLALYLAQSGMRIRGMDDALSSRWRRILLEAGCEIFRMEEGLPEGVDRVVHSSGVAANHTLLQAARSRNLPLVRRGELLAEVASGKRFIAVAGSHGKTTTTGMLAFALQKSGVPCDYILGGLYADPEELPARHCDAPWLVAEVDESDGTIAGFSPEITLLVNLDWDHADHYTTPETMLKTFRGLLGRTTGKVILPQTLKEAMLTDAGNRSAPVPHTFGEAGDYQGSVRVLPGETGSLLRLGGLFGSEREIPVAAGGAFNGHNALAALAVVDAMEGRIPGDVLAAFPGIHRRQSLLWQGERLRVFGDYAHHPTEIEALLQHWRIAYPGWRLCVVFQPHRFSRTRQFGEGFANALGLADELFLLDTYAAGETPNQGGTAADLQAHFPAASRPQLLLDREAGLLQLESLLQADATPRVLGFVGAGDIEGWAELFVAGISRASSARTGSTSDWWTRTAAQVSPGCRLREEEELGRKTTLRVGGRARYYAEPATVDDLSTLVRCARQVDVPVFFLGRGSNLIVTEEGFNGLVIRLAGEEWKRLRLREDGAMEVAAGVRTKELCAFACRHGLAGFEFLEGIPGTVGGALRMNAGAMGSWMFDVVREIRLIDDHGNLHTLDKEACGVSYRTCRALENAIAVDAVLTPRETSTPDSIRTVVETFAGRRRASQPRDPSAGCIFKNPEGDFAGRLIDQFGLKGKRIGGAEISTVHGNFIINRGNATSDDVLALIREVRETVRRESGITLDPEVLLLGKTWREVLE